MTLSTAWRARRLKDVAIRSTAACAAAALAVGFAAAPAAAAPARPDFQALTDAIVDAGAPGAVVTVEDGDGTWTGTSGAGKLWTGSDPNPQGRIRIGSITKTFTATMVLQLVEEGAIELDAPIDRYLPGVLPYEEDVTVRQLLQQNSGVPDYEDDLWPDARTAAQHRFASYEPEELVAIATQDPLVPSEEFHYSNTNYILLGMLIEEVAQRDLAAELRERILIPADLDRTYLAGAFPFMPSPAMRGYEALGAEGDPLTDLTAFNMTASWSTGAIVSTQAEVNRFFEALLSGDLLGDELLAEMKTTIPAFPGFGYGLGLAGGEPCGTPIWGHVGGSVGYLTYSFSDDTAEHQITITVNQSLTAAPEVSDAITAMVGAAFCA
jgi:D-alanyl-D-alanine carboxypeptidase